MKIALIGPVYPYRGGIAHYTSMLHRALCAHGHQALLVSFKRQYPSWLFPGQSDRDPDSFGHRIDGAQYWLDSLNPLSWLITFARIRRWHPDLLILQWWTTFWSPHWLTLGLLNRCLLGCPLVYICHNVLPHEKHVTDALLVRAVLSMGSHFVVHSAEQARVLRTLLPNANPRVCTMPAFDLFADRLVPRLDARRKLQIAAGRPVALFFGIVRPYKGLHHLLRALPLIRAQLDLLLIIAGEFWKDKESYLDLIRQLAVEDMVQIDDRYIPDPEVGLYFSAADLLVAPYQQVTASAVVQAALSVGCPVVTTDIGGLGEIVRDGENGFTVPPADHRALAHAIVRYFQEGLPRSTMERDRDVLAGSWSRLVDTITLI